MSASSRASSGFTSVFKFNGTAIAELNKISSPKLNVGDIDVTNNDSPQGVEESIPGIIKTGSITIEGNYVGDDTTQKYLTQCMTNRTVAAAQLIFPRLGTNTVTWTFNAYVKAFDVEAPFDNKQTFKAEIKIANTLTLP